MMIPTQVSGIGFYQFMYSIGWTNSLWPLIIPATATPAMVFFMRQYLMASLSLDIVDSARIDGSREFNTFNKIIIPIMKPAMATQAIFTFVFHWNRLFEPLILLTDGKKVHHAHHGQSAQGGRYLQDRVRRSLPWVIDDRTALVHSLLLTLKAYHCWSCTWGGTERVVSLGGVYGY